MEIKNFILLFIGLWLGFEGLFWVLEGLEGQGGKLDWDYYRVNIHLLESYRVFLQENTLKLMSFLGYEVQQFGRVMKINGFASGIRLNNGCLGIGVLSVWTAFTLAFPQRWGKRLINLFLGLLGLIAINIARLAILLYLYRNPGTAAVDIDQHSVFNIVSYGFILLMGYQLMKHTPISSKTLN